MVRALVVPRTMESSTSTTRLPATVEEIRKIVGADSLGYLSIEHVTQLAIHSKCGFCAGCFTGHYPVPAPNETMDIVYDKPLSQSQTKKRL